MSDSHESGSWLREFVQRERLTLERMALDFVVKHRAASASGTGRDDVETLFSGYYTAVVAAIGDGDIAELDHALTSMIRKAVLMGTPATVMLSFNVSFRLAVTRLLKDRKVSPDLRLDAMEQLDAVFEQTLVDFYDQYQQEVAANLSHTTASLDLARKELNILNSFALSLRDSVSVNDLHMAMANSIAVLLSLDDCVLYVVERGILVQRGAFGVKLKDGEILSPITIAFGQGVVGAAALTKKPQRIDDLSAVPGYIPDVYPGRSELAVPVVFEDRVIGVFDSESTKVGFFNDQDQRVLEAMANIAAPRIAAALATEQSERLLRESVRDAEKRNRFYHTLSHEIRTPLTAIVSSVEILKKYAGRMTEEQQSQRFDKVVNASGMLNQLVDQILTLHESRSSVVAPQPVAVDIEPLVQESVEPLMASKNRAADLVTTFELTHKTVWADQDLLYRVLTNLVTNALKYSDAGAEIRVEVLTSEAALELSVRDHGVGIAEKDKELIFEDYYRASNRGRAPGAGLGLTIVQESARHLGGAISVWSEVGVGSKFTLKMPLRFPFGGAKKARRDGEGAPPPETDGD